MSSATTIRKKLFNNHYEPTAKKLLEVKPQIWYFVNRDNEECHYSEEFDILYYIADLEYVMVRIEQERKIQREHVEYQRKKMRTALNNLVDIACFTYAPDEEHKVIIQLNDLVNLFDDGKTITLDDIRKAMVE